MPADNFKNFEQHRFVQDAPPGTSPFDIRKFLAESGQRPAHTWQAANRLRDLMDVRQVPILHYKGTPVDPQGRNAFYIVHPYANQIGAQLRRGHMLLDSRQYSKLLGGRAGGVFLGRRMRDIGTLAHELGHARNARFNRQFMQGMAQNSAQSRQRAGKAATGGIMALTAAGLGTAAGGASYLKAGKPGFRNWIRQLFGKGGSKSSKVLATMAGMLAGGAGLSTVSSVSNLFAAKAAAKQAKKFKLAEQYTASVHAAKALRQLLLDDKKWGRYTDTNGQALRSYINALQTNATDILDKLIGVR